MAENIELAKINFDVTKVIRDASLLRDKIKELGESQKKLKEDNKEGTAEFVKQEAELKRLRSEYNLHLKAIVDSTKAVDEQTRRQAKLDIVLNDEATTINDLRRQNKALNELRNSANLETAEGIKELTALNKKLNENNEKIKENVDAYTQQKINIGNYTDSIREAFSMSNLLSGGSRGVSDALKGATTQMGNLTRASLRFLATPWGVVLGVIAGAFLLIQNALNRNAESSSKLQVAFAGFTGILNTLLNALEPLGTFLVDVLVKSLEYAEQGVYALLDGFSALASFFGKEDLAIKVQTFNNALKEGSKGAKEVAKATEELKFADQELAIIQKRTQLNAEKQRQIRDDERLSLEERIEANNELARVLEQGQRQRLAIVRKQQKQNAEELRQNANNRQAQLRQQELALEVLDIQEEIAGFQSEQIVNQASLEKEYAERRIQQLQDEFDLRVAQAGLEESQFAERIALVQKFQEDQEKIINEKLQANLISTTQAELQKQELANETAEKIAEISTQQAEAQIEADKEALELKKEFEELAFLDELDRLEQQNATKFEIEKAQLDRELQLAKDKAMEEIENEKLLKATLERLEKDYEKKVAKMQDLANATKLDKAKALFSGLSGIIDSESKAGKGIALAVAGINLAQAISEANKVPFPANIVAIAQNLATGIKAIKDIQAVNIPSASGSGFVSGGSSPNVTLPQTTNLGLTDVNLGDIASSGNEVIQNQLNASLGEGIREAVSQGAKEGTMAGTQEGITTLGETRQIENQSTF